MRETMVMNSKFSKRWWNSGDGWGTGFLPILFSLVVWMAVLVVGPVLGPQALAQVASHPNDLPLLNSEALFPRCTYRELADVGFPDHMHAWHWSDWTPLVDENGVTYGPDSFCNGGDILPREGLVIGESVQRYGHFAIHHNPAYGACHILHYLELLDMASRTIPDMLGLALQDTLHIISPDNVEPYRQMTGYETWRLYKLEGDQCISEPLPVLQARTLEGHALFGLVTEWLLAKSIPVDLPPWFRCGLAEYISESGIHLVNYMGQYRTEGSVLISPLLIDTILSQGPNPDLELDRKHYRQACYSSFLMVWELVENQGGLLALQDFLANLAQGMSLDEASSLVYGVDLQGLTAMLDPASLGEPIGKSVQSRSPHTDPNK